MNPSQTQPFASSIRFASSCERHDTHISQGRIPQDAAQTTPWATRTAYGSLNKYTSAETFLSHYAIDLPISEADLCGLLLEMVTVDWRSAAVTCRASSSPRSADISSLYAQYVIIISASEILSKSMAGTLLASAALRGDVSDQYVPDLSETSCSHVPSQESRNMSTSSSYPRSMRRSKIPDPVTASTSACYITPSIFKTTGQGRSPYDRCGISSKYIHHPVEAMKVSILSAKARAACVVVSETRQLAPQYTIDFTELSTTCLARSVVKLWGPANARTRCPVSMP